MSTPASDTPRRRRHGGRPTGRGGGSAGTAGPSRHCRTAGCTGSPAAPATFLSAVRLYYSDLTGLEPGLVAAYDNLLPAIDAALAE